MPASRKRKSSPTKINPSNQPAVNGNSSDGPADAILAMQDPYMDQIIPGQKTYESRKYRLQPSVQRVWFCRVAPHSAITHISEILPARTRDADKPLEEDGLGNREFNTHDKDWRGYEYAYRILTLYELNDPIPLSEMRGKYGFKGAPRAVLYVPREMAEDVIWDEQIKILDRCKDV
ncbi:hypothetical protein QBC35DRAFT_503775 [Podospora australis]|uniref:Uncharacterized protein n=1 Tax=Podospora australis TaxID=1536484 RepID=A0AAN7AGU2_9PEZI|nr:hypothetical protein QBC35DRAFT_503775 [Podospora australis]